MLNHPNIAQIYGIEDRALIMELVDGETLRYRSRLRQFSTTQRKWPMRSKLRMKKESFITTSRFISLSEYANSCAAYAAWAAR
jgi:hypothetical protein